VALWPCVIAILSNKTRSFYFVVLRLYGLVFSLFFLVQLGISTLCLVALWPCAITNLCNCSAAIHVLLEWMASYFIIVISHIVIVCDSFLPELPNCITVIQGCIGFGNSSLIAALINMSSLCSSTCDVTAAMLCLNRYYQQVSVAVISGNIDCVHLSRFTWFYNYIFAVKHLTTFSWSCMVTGLHGFQVRWLNG